jgi:hypothetical protein
MEPIHTWTGNTDRYSDREISAPKEGNWPKPRKKRLSQKSLFFKFYLPNIGQNSQIDKHDSIVNV